MTWNKEVLIDSNLIIYASNTLATEYKDAKNFINTIKTNNLIPIISHQNMFETIRVLTHHKYKNPMSVNEAIGQVETYKSFSRIIYPTFQTDEIAIKIIKKYDIKSNSIFDAYLVATMISNEIGQIATLNVKNFDFYKEIKVIKPF